ncbi:aquaporin-5-like [Actinia tenebrosa]|uniref:Aquaporin-5-like n=1 Tax=Actinia tenebrosa TaxID=6105 RepID=A0A6P8HCM2_ACTTE|nr:aquaporin-5-like [Actinia tenebrosa]
MLKETITKDFWICMAAEFLATFFFVFLTTGSAITWDPSRPPTTEHISLSFGLSISTLAMSILHISGGLINPAVSAAQTVTGKISPVRGAFYIIVQVIGGSANNNIVG